MKTYKLFSKLLLVAITCFAVASCELFPQDDNTYDGPPTIAFEFEGQVVDAGAGDVGATVQVITADGRANALNVNYSVSGDAEAGSDYTVVTPSPLSIASGSYENSIVINVDGSNIPAGTARTLTLTLQDSDGVEVAGNEDLNSYTLTIRGTGD